jgi:uncharacterized protein (TIGR03083 family)
MSTDVWPMIRDERAAFAETISDLDPEQWDRPSLCAGWRVRDVVAHMIAAGEKTKGSFLVGLMGAGFRFNSMVEADIKRIGGTSSTDELVARYRKTISTTNGPPGPPMAMLGEVVLHGEDVRRPLGIKKDPSEAAIGRVADFYKGSNLLLGTKKRIAGLRLIATDTGWSTGEGPEVSGPAMALLVTMTGRPGAEGDLSGPGAATLIGRL